MMKAVLVSVYWEKHSNTAEEHFPLKHMLRAWLSTNLKHDLHFRCGLDRFSVHVSMKSLCPGFSWDVVSCLPSSWYSAMFWVQYVKNVDNPDVFSCCSVVFRLQSRIFQLLMPSQGTWPKLANSVFHTMWRPIQFRNWEVGGEGFSPLGDWLGVGRWVVSNCPAHHLYIPILLLLLLSFC